MSWCLQIQAIGERDEQCSQCVTMQANPNRLTHTKSALTMALYSKKSHDTDMGGDARIND